MSLFVGTHQNRFDAKGRVSVPAIFRTGLRASEAAALILRPAHQHKCVEAWPDAVFNAQTARRLELMDPFSAAYDQLAATLYADVCTLKPDSEGRILLPDSLITYAGLNDAVTFVGIGPKFLIWEPKAAEKFRDESRERARASDARASEPAAPRQLA